MTMREEERLSRRRFLKAMGLGLVGLSMTGFLTSIFGSSHVLDILKPGDTSSTDSFRALQNFRINSVETTPKVDLNTFQLKIDGIVDTPQSWSLAELKDQFSEIEQISDFHCVEGWGIKNVRWKGIRLRELIEKVNPSPMATHITFYSLGGIYTESLSVAEASETETLLAYGLYDKNLPASQGYPLRIIIPRMFGYKGAKWVYRMEFTDQQHLGYWEKRGYHVDGVTPA